MILPALFLVFAQAASPSFVTHVQDAYPAVSPDGSTLVFQSTRSGRWALYLSDLEGGNVRVLVDSGDDPVVPAWSPNGERVAFAATADGHSEIFIVDRDGTNRRQLTRDGGDASHPHFARDGRIFFNSGREVDGREVQEIYSMAQDGSRRRQHTRCNAVCTFPSPSPDGRFIAYRRVFDTPGLSWAQAPVVRNSEVVVARMNGSQERNVSGHPAFDGWPVWSLDSRWIVFASGRDGAPLTGQIYAVQPDGAHLQRITHGPMSNVQPSMSPDGAAVFTYFLFETPEREAGSIARWPFAPQP